MWVTGYEELTYYQLSWYILRGFIIQWLGKTVLVRITEIICASFSSKNYT